MSKLLHACWTVCIVAGLAACESELPRPTEPDATLPPPALATSGPMGCPMSSSVVVTDEAGLLAALAGASAGDVIAIDGLVTLTADVAIDVAGVTLTCDTPGSGVEALAGAGVSYLLRPGADDVVIDRLFLDATNAGIGAMVAFGPGGIDGVQLIDSDVTCGPVLCAFFVGVSNALIARNDIQGTPSTSGLHLQGSGAFLPGGTRDIPIDGSQVVRNTIVAGAAAGSPPFAAIRIRDGSGTLVSRNTVDGEWSNSISPTRLFDSVIEQNVLTGAQEDGISFQNFVEPDIARGNTVANNRVSGANVGVRVKLACANTFRGNNLGGNTLAAAVFEATTGANLFFGNGGLVIDDGAFDCDDDAVDDPNLITGQGALGQGAPPGPGGMSAGPAIIQ